MQKNESKMIMARSKAANVNLMVPSTLTGDHCYAWMAKQMDMYGKLPFKAWSIHSRLKVICGWYGGFRVSKKRGQRVVSHATQDARLNRILISFTDLWKLGFRIEEPRNLSGKHIDLLVQYWTGQIPALKETEPREPLSPSTIQNRLSCLRTLCSWLDKTGVVKNTKFYATQLHDLKRSGIAERDKSWKGNDVDFDTVLVRAMAEQVEVGMQLLMISAFGLRLKESICFDVRQADPERASVWIQNGAKGGLGREVPVTTDRQREILSIVLKFAMSRPRVKHLGLADRSLLQSINRSYSVFKKIGINKKDSGVTVHGLRHQFAHQIMEGEGLTPPVKGGARDQMPKDDRQAIELMVSRVLGHSRPGITANYCGSSHARSAEPLKITSFNLKVIHNDDPR